MPIRGQRTVLKFRGIIRAQLKDVIADLNSLIKKNTTTPYLTQPQLDAFTLTLTTCEDLLPVRVPAS
jgi:hypothetical protein